MREIRKNDRDTGGSSRINLGAFWSGDWPDRVEHENILFVEVPSGQGRHTLDRLVGRIKSTGLG